MDTISQNKNIVTSFIDALFTKGDLGAVDEYLAEDYVDHDPPMGFPASREGMRAAAAASGPRSPTGTATSASTSRRGT
jgi:predicted SnoaL-like aldol condensation-catalyzing enzyme